MPFEVTTRAPTGSQPCRATQHQGRAVWRLRAASTAVPAQIPTLVLSSDSGLVRNMPGKEFHWAPGEGHEVFTLVWVTSQLWNACPNRWPKLFREVL